MTKIPGFRFFPVFVGLIFLYACAQPVPKKTSGLLEGKFSEFKLEAECKDDPLISEIRKDMEDKTSILDLMKFYLKELEKDASPDSRCLKKLEKLFACGQAKKQVKGHFYGITLVLKKGGCLLQGRPNP